MGELGFLFTAPEDERAESTAGVIGVDEDGADLCGVGGRIEEGSFAAGAVVTAEEGAAIAPAATAGDKAGVVRRLGDEVGTVFDELGIEAERVAERTFDLRGRVVMLLQRANRLLNQRAQSGDVSGRGDTDSIGCG